MCSCGGRLSKKCEVEVDTTKADAELKALEIQSNITAQNVMRDVRKGYSALTLFLDIFHVALPESVNLMASAALMAGQMFADLAAAETISGVFAAKAALTFTAASMMFYRAMMLQQQASEIEQSINSTIGLINLVGGL